jgi:hypothetical protein
MPIVVRLAILALVGLLFAAPAQAAPLFPLQTGNWMEMDKQDNSGHKWTVRTMVFEEVNLGGQQYFRIQELYYDPYGINGGDTFSEFYMRSTDTELFVYTGGGEESAFKLGPVGTNWIYEGGQTKKEIVAIEPITIPYGGTYTAYKYKQYAVSDPNGGYDLEWVVPGMGIVKEEDHWLDQSQSARIPLTSVLARVGSNPLFFPLKTGMRLTFNASDNVQPTPNTWKMYLEVKEQVTLNDGLKYFHIRQTNYDPLGGDVNNEFYVRCDVSQVFACKLDETPHLEYQAAAPGTTWSFTRPSHPTIYKRISSIQSVNVLGRSILAYMIDLSPDPTFPMTSLMTEFVAPGLGPVEMLDWWIADPNRAPLQFLLTGVSQGGASPAVSLLLMD